MAFWFDSCCLQDLVDQVNYINFFFFNQALSFYTICDLNFALRITEIYLDPLTNQQTAKHDVTLKNIVLCKLCVDLGVAVKLKESQPLQ